LLDGELANLYWYHGDNVVCKVEWGFSYRTIGMGFVERRMYDDIIQTLNNTWYILKLK